MQFNHRSITRQVMLLLCLIDGFQYVAKSQTQQQSPQAPQVTLQEAIKARTEAAVLQQETLSLDREILQTMRKVVAKADGKQMEGTILLTKDRYAEAVQAFQEATRLYQQVTESRKLLDNIANTKRAISAALLLAESTAKPEQLQEGRRLQINAEGYLEAGEIELALSELEKARKALEALISSTATATLEEAVAARTAMLAAREPLKELPEYSAAGVDDALQEAIRRSTRAERVTEASGAASKRGSLTELLQRARRSDRAATDALEGRQYGQARTLFAAAEKLYREAGALQGRRDAIVALRKSVEESMKMADQAFKGDARPASFERGRLTLSDANKSFSEDDLDATKKQLAAAAEHFASARSEAEKMNALTDAQQAWSAALAAADEELLTKHTGSQFHAAKAKAEEARLKASAGQSEAAASGFKQAVTVLAEAVGAAKTRENAAKAVPIIARLDAALGSRDKFTAEDILSELEGLIPTDSRMTALRDKVAALPGLKKQVVVDVGGGVTLEFVLIRPGSFMMGSENGDSDEKPVHRVTITKPYYLGKYEVTQEQWQAVMGSNPSNFKGPTHPVEQVSWQDVQSYISKLQEKALGQQFALPTEAEWEYAARAGSTEEYAGDLDSMAWYSSNSGSQTHPVGKKRPNAWGLYDMHGNVWEWVQDWYGEYAAGSVNDPQGILSGADRVYRGCCWYSDARFCRSVGRFSLGPGLRGDSLGFRLCFQLHSRSDGLEWHRAPSRPQEE